MAARNVRQRNIRAMVGVGLAPGQIAARYGWTEMELWQWCSEHDVPLDAEVLRGEAPMKTYYVCTLCGSQSEQFPDKESLREHRQSVHGEAEDMVRYDAEQIRSMSEAGKTVQEICVAQGIDVAALVNLCRRKKIEVAGLPGSRDGQRAKALQAEVDALRTPTARSEAEPVDADGGPSDQVSAVAETQPPAATTDRTRYYQAVVEAVAEIAQEQPEPPSPSAEPILQEVIKQTRASVLQEEREIEARRVALEGRRKDLRVLEEAQRVLERLAKEGAA